MKRQKGITLIALVITIIVLLILVGVTITMLTGENGILNQATKSTIETYHGTVKEQIILGADEYFTAKNVDGYKEDVIKYLLNEKSYTEVVDDYYRVKVEKVASTIKTGKGKTKAEGDIYVIEKENTTTAQNTKIASTVISDIKVADTTVGNTKYVLRYYEKYNKSKDLLYLYANGTIENPKPIVPIEPGDVQITYIEDLVELQQAVNNGTTYQEKEITKDTIIAIQNDLDFTNIDNYDPDDINRDTLKTTLTSEGFTSIGTDTNPFIGIFEGNNYKISNLTMGSSSVEYAGLFGYNSGTIQNLNMQSPVIQAKNVGTIAYSNSGTIQNCTVNESRLTHTGGNIGGIVYQNESLGKIKECSNSKGSYTAQGQYAGAGIVAINDGLVDSCINNTEITKGSCYPGGIAYMNNGTVQKCENHGKIKANFSAGVIYENNGTVLKCINTGDVTSSAPNCGGIIGENKTTAVVDGCINKGNISGIQYVGGVIGLNSAENTVKNCDNKGVISSNLNYTGGIVGYSNQKIIIDNCNNYNDISAKDQHIGGIIGSSANLSEIRNCINEGKIDMKEDNCYIGGIAGSLGSCVIENCKNKNTISFTESWAAGIVGKTSDANITNCINEGDIQFNQEISSRSSANDIGGIIGEGGVVNITNCINSGNITTIGNEIGGIIGKVATGENTTINQCYNTGNIINTYSSADSNNATGGIVGTVYYKDGAKINKCYNSGSIETLSCQNTGGILGESLYMCYLTNVYNLGNISGKKYVGGISGYAKTKILNAYNSGNISGEECISGIVGWDVDSKGKQNIYNIGNVTGSTSPGQLFGKARICSIQNVSQLYCSSNISVDSIGIAEMSPTELEQLKNEITSMTDDNIKSQTFVNTLNSNVATINSTLTETDDALVQWKLDSTGRPTLDITY